MVRRIEWFAGIGACVAAVIAIAATLFVPIGETGLFVNDRLVYSRKIYASSHGIGPLVGICLLIALLAAMLLWGAYQHARRGNPSGRAILCWATVIYVLVGL